MCCLSMKSNAGAPSVQCRDIWQSQFLLETVVQTLYIQAPTYATIGRFVGRPAPPPPLLPAADGDDEMVMTWRKAIKKQNT